MNPAIARASVASCLRQYATFSGRARRSEFWCFQLFVVFALAVAVAADVALSLATSISAPVLTPLAGLGLLVPQLAVQWRRLHDTGRRGAWWFIALLPFGGIVLVVLSCFDSEPRPNRFGPSTKALPSAGTGYGQPQQLGQPQQS